MKKLLCILIALTLVLGCSASYAAAPASDNVSILGNGGAIGISPVTQIVRVRYGLRGNSTATLSSGDVVVWDLTSADGLTISKCVTDNQQNYAGVLVTDILTADSSAVRGETRNWGYMVTQGYCLANVDTSNATAGQGLYANGATLVTSFGTVDLAGGTIISQDIGVLLADTGVDGLMRVWLN